MIVRSLSKQDPVDFLSAEDYSQENYRFAFFQYKTAHERYEDLYKSLSHPTEEKKLLENMLCCHFGMLTCMLGTHTINLAYANRQLNRLKEQYQNLISDSEYKNENKKLLMEIKRCEQRFKNLSGGKSQASYFVYYLQNISHFLERNDASFDLMMLLRNDALEAADNALFLYNLDRSPRSMIDELLKQKTYLNDLYISRADRYFDKASKKHYQNDEQIRAKKIDLMHKAIELYKISLNFHGSFVSSMSKEALLQHEDFTKKILPLHLSILFAWYCLALTIDPQHQRKYLEEMKQHIITHGLENVDHPELDDYWLTCELLDSEQNPSKENLMQLSLSDKSTVGTLFSLNHKNEEEKLTQVNYLEKDGYRK